MAQIALPEMRKYKYSDQLATGSVAAGGTIGILIPPSVVMVIYGILTETSISELFLAGFLPGVLTVLGFMLAISIMCRRNPKLGPPAERVPIGQRWKATYSVWGTLVLFMVVIGGLYVGWFSPTDSHTRRGAGMHGRGCAHGTRSFGLGFALLNIDGALKEGAVFNNDALGDDVTVQDGRLLQLDAIAAANIAVNLAVNYDFFRIHIGANAAVRSDGEAMAAQFNAALNFAVKIKIFAAR